MGGNAGKNTRQKWQRGIGRCGGLVAVVAGTDNPLHGIIERTAQQIYFLRKLIGLRLRFDDDKRYVSAV